MSHKQEVVMSSTDGVASTSMVVYRGPGAVAPTQQQPSEDGQVSATVIPNTSVVSRVRSAADWNVIFVKVIGYGGAGVFIGGGGALCAVPLPGVQVFGGLFIVSGVGIFTYTNCRISSMQERRIEAANDQYDYLNRVHLAALAVFHSQISVLAHNIAVFENQVGEMHNQNAAHARHNQALKAEIDRLIGEGQKNRETVLKLQTVTSELNQTSTQFLTGITENRRDQAIDQAAVQEQLDQLTELVERLDGKSVQPLVTLARQFQQTVTHVLEIASVEERLRETQAALHRTEGRLGELNRQYDQLNEQNQQTADRLQVEVARLTGEISRLEQVRGDLTNGPATTD